MRLKLNLSVDKQQNLIPINYQYPISSWIYKTIHASDSSFSSWLHDHGYSLGNRRFKLFTFSNIYFVPYWKRQGDRIKIFSGKADLRLSFYVEQAVENFIIGLFQKQAFLVGDCHSQGRFEVKAVEGLPQPVFRNKMRFRGVQPICISHGSRRRNYAEYLIPGQELYQQLFLDNLIYKYLIALRPNERFEDVKQELVEKCPIELKILNQPRSKLITIKAGTKQESKVRGYMYDFELTAPIELIEFGYVAGFGEKNALGFGFVDVLQKKSKPGQANGHSASD